MTFICQECRRGTHDKCPGGTWCDCLHRGSDNPIPATPRQSD